MRYDLQFWVRTFIWGILARELWVAGRTFKRVNTGLGGIMIGVAFGNMFYQATQAPIFEPLLVPALAAFIASIALFECAAHTVRGLFFSYIFSNDEPQFVCEAGPFRYLRHPFYASYLLAQAGALMLFPNILTIAIAIGLLAYFSWATYFEEQKFARSARAAKYAEYKRRAGRFTPKLMGRA